MIHFAQGLQYWFVELNTEFQKQPDVLDLSVYAEKLLGTIPFECTPKLISLHQKASHQGDTHQVVAIWPKGQSWNEWESHTADSLKSESQISEVDEWLPLGLIPLIWSWQNPEIAQAIVYAAQGSVYVYHPRLKFWFEESDTSWKEFASAADFQDPVYLSDADLHDADNSNSLGARGTKKVDVSDLDLRSGQYQSQIRQYRFARKLLRPLLMICALLILSTSYVIYQNHFTPSQVSVKANTSLQGKIQALESTWSEFQLSKARWNQLKSYTPIKWYQNLQMLRESLGDVEIQRVLLSRSQESSRWFLKINSWQAYEDLKDALNAKADFEVSWSEPRQIKSHILVQLEAALKQVDSSNYPPEVLP